jgi:hypothetical protein
MYHDTSMAKSTRHKLDNRRGRLQELRSTGRRIVHGNSLVFELLMLFKKVGDTCLNGGLLAGSDISIFLMNWKMALLLSEK